MGYKHHLASALADALLAGPPSKACFAERMHEALDQSYNWVEPFAARIYKCFGNDIALCERHQIIEFICNDRGFNHALTGLSKPVVRRRFLYNPIMRPRAAPLAASPVPTLSTPRDLAEWLCLTISDLDWFADLHSMIRTTDGPLCHYRYKWISKRLGGYRLLESPKSALLSIQRKILRDILDLIPVHPAAHGFCRGRSTLTYVAPHVGQPVVLRMDLKNFFGSIPSGRIHALFQTLGYPEPVARYLMGLCTNAIPTRADFKMPAAGPAYPSPWLERRKLCQPHLPQGAPTSPALANLCAFRLDCRLTALAENLGARYTRYADDIAFSGDSKLSRNKTLVPLIGGIALEEGFDVNFRKTRLMPCHQRQILTGIVINQKNNIDRRDYDRLKAILHNCRRFSPQSQNREQHLDFRAHLLGSINYVTRLNWKRGEALKNIFENIDW